jgi:exodeoxyribonuclease VII large subunit
MAHEVESKVSSEHSPWQVSQLSKSLKDWIEKLGRVWVEVSCSSSKSEEQYLSAL